MKNLHAEKVSSIEKGKVSLQNETPFGRVTFPFHKFITEIKVKLAMYYNKVISHLTTFGGKITFVRLGSSVIINSITFIKVCACEMHLHTITFNDTRVTFFLI